MGIPKLDSSTIISSSEIEMEKHRHKEGKHLLVLDEGITYVGVPRSSISEDGTLCFSVHNSSDETSSAPSPPALEPEKCCLLENAHVHAHVHHGEITEDILLEQCLEEACCTLPFSGFGTSYKDSYKDEHEHTEGCGHNQIAHGDHFDWLVPLKDGSFLVSHKSTSAAGDSQSFEHGRLVKIGESLGKLKRRPKQIIDVFSYESPKRKGYEILVPQNLVEASVVNGPLTPPRDIRVDMPEAIGRSVLNVLGICCPSEVPLIKKILEPLPGVKEVTVNVTSRTVSVLHDRLLTPEGRLVKALNEARLDASLHRRGEFKRANRWPSPWTWACGVLLAISLFKHFFQPLQWVALGAVAVGIPPILLKSYASLRRYILDINILMVIAVGGAIGLHDYIEAASIVFLFTLAEWLEGRSNDRARAALASGVNSGPRNAVLAGTGAMVSIEEVLVGTLVVVKTGEMVPIDGVVESGKCSVDESSLTGESRPVEKSTGDGVWAGTLNMAGYIIMRTTALSGDSASARIIKLVEEAQNKRSYTEQLVARFAKYYTPVLVVAAILIALIPLATHTKHEKHWLYMALVLLVVACPCALVISTPVATACGLHQAARLGVIIKGGNFLETLAQLKSLAMDKTGTLTEGLFRVSKVVVVDKNESDQQVLRWISSVESCSSHPMAAALVTYARLQGVEPSAAVSDFQVVQGEGVSAVVEGHLVEIGNARLANRLGWSQEAMEPLRDESATLGWVAVNGRQVAVFSIQDHLREEAPEAVESLMGLGLRVDMLTGDNKATAESLRSKLGAIVVHAELLPEDKVRIIQELKVGHSPTGMIGDGINDAPALAASDVGFAMGLAGSAMAMETSDVFLMTDDLRKLAEAVKLGRRVRIKVIQNVVISILTKVTIVALSFAGYAHLWLAVVADVGTCIVVIFNSMLLLEKRSSKKTSGDHHHHQHHDHGNEDGSPCCGGEEESKVHGHHGHGHGHHNHFHFHGNCLDFFRRTPAPSSCCEEGSHNKKQQCEDEACIKTHHAHHSHGLLQHKHSKEAI